MNREHSKWARRFALEGKKNIQQEGDLGIINGKITVEVPFTNGLSLGALYAPPYVSSDFRLEVRIFGEALATEDYSWLPYQVTRRSSIRGVEVENSTTLIENQRGAIMQITLCNTTAFPVEVPLQFEIAGGADYATGWDFVRPTGVKRCLEECTGNLLVRFNDAATIVLGAKDMIWEDYCSFWRTGISLASGQTSHFHLVLGIGERSETIAAVSAAVNDPVGTMERSSLAWEKRASRVMQNLPEFWSEDPRLQDFYHRSALHLLLNRWEVSEFVLNPLYTTGSINGGCVCSYLWDYAAGWEIFPLIDARTAKNHIKAFLNINLEKHFTFNPLSGAGWGPWYYVNQEKIVFLIYHYVTLSGDEAFLDERVEGKTILEWAVYHALFGDQMEDEANLIDYGAGNHHLELRREYRYDHFLPDLNARRYQTYLAAEKLCQMAGSPSIDFRDRAEKLKSLIRRELWSETDQWWFFKKYDGKKELRYTLQLFKLIGSPVIDQEEEALIAHLNEDEFLSEFGLHSMSKKDPAYDQVDIDNGGGGACCCFTPQIIERLYKAGYSDKAEDLLQRILWWGDRLPYWSDSFTANVMDYRRDTPLQNAVGAVCGAQSIIFGMFGIQVESENGISVNPIPPSFSPSIGIQGVKIRNLSIDIEVRDGSYEVRAGGRVYHGTVGTSVFLPLAEGGQGGSSSPVPKIFEAV